MSYFRRLLGRLFRAAPLPRTKAPLLESLESRQLFSSGLAVTGIHLTGTVRDITSVVLSFNQPLDPTVAQDLQSYQFGRVIPSTSNDTSGLSLGNILDFLAVRKAAGSMKAAVTKAEALIKNYKVQFTSAAYDATTYSVTLTPVRPFNGVTWFRVLRVYGVGINAITDLYGDTLNGGANTYVHWFPYIGKVFTYRDAGGDLVTIRLRGPGQIVAFLQTNTYHAPTIFILNGKSKSVLSGKVIQARTGSGVAVIPELQGGDTVQNELAINPDFEILTTEP
ncbi:MAG TPA: hypothetical protein VHV77_10250 [Pirellulales bacterium]|nr:hypothetical protein [Pirellulales bacterium]